LRSAEKGSKERLSLHFSKCITVLNHVLFCLKKYVGKIPTIFFYFSISTLMFNSCRRLFGIHTSTTALRIRSNHLPLNPHPNQAQPPEPPTMCQKIPTTSTRGYCFHILLFHSSTFPSSHTHSQFSRFAAVQKQFFESRKNKAKMF